MFLYVDYLLVIDQTTLTALQPLKIKQPQQHSGFEIFKPQPRVMMTRL